MASLLIESAKILANDLLTTANILIEDGVIKRISKTRLAGQPDEKIQAEGLIALPGLIDAHVHLRDLELSYKETFETGTQAAASGGVTSVLDMPNTRPPTISAERLAEKMARASGCLFSNVGFQAGLVESGEEIDKMSRQGAVAFKLYLNKSMETFDYSRNDKLLPALKAVALADSVLTVHAEDGDEIRRTQAAEQSQGKAGINDFLRAHKPQTETTAVERIIGLARRLGVKTHICHISIPAAARLLARARQTTCEATPHHLLLNSSVFRKQGTSALCVPPIRSEPTRRGLWRLFQSGRVNIVATDHAPHTLAEKNTTDAWKAAPGVPGLETLLPVMFTQVQKGKLRLSRLVQATSAWPAKIFGLSRKGMLAEGFDADIILVDPKARTRIDPEKFLSKARYSPFAGMECRGFAAYTIVNGNITAERGRIVGPPSGRILRR